MVSPACEIKEGAGAYQSTDGGFDATPAATITIHLIDSSADSWSISCITTDDTSVAATVTSGLTINTVARTATFTAPVAGKAYRFRSQVNGGIGANGRIDSTLTTTFCVYTLTGGRRVIAADETTEGDATFGWIVWLNDIIRNPATATPAGSDTQLQYNNASAMGGAANVVYSSGKLTISTDLAITSSAGVAWASAATTPKVSQADVATNSATGVALTVQAQNATGTTATGGNLVLTSGTGTSVAGNVILQTGGTARLTLSPTIATWGLSSMAATANSRARAYSDIANVQTTDATATTLFSWSILDEAITMVTAEVGACLSTAADTAAYVRRAKIKSDGGAVTVGTVDTSFTDESVAGWDCTIDNSTTTGRVRVTGAGGSTVDWGGIVSRLEVSHA
jgi:hypothetical protein